MWCTFLVALNGLHVPILGEAEFCHWYVCVCVYV